MKTTFARLLRFKVAVPIFLCLAACGGDNGKPGVGASAPIVTKPNNQPVAVSTVLAQERDFDLLLDAAGVVSAVSSVEVKAQLSAPVLRVHVQEGQMVRAGDLLFTLDQRNDAANLAKAQAQQSRSSALLADAQRQLARSMDLVAKGFVSQGAAEAARTQVDTQLASVTADKAAVEAAALAISYSNVRASIGGRLGAIPVVSGSAVVANQTTLTTITQLDPINVTFPYPQRSLSSALQALNTDALTVRVNLPEQAAPFRGRLVFVDSTVDALTGTVRARARLDNRDHRLWPGAFVKVQVVTESLRKAIVIPQAAVIESVRGPLVYQVQDGRAQQRPVKVLATQDGWSAVQGVAAGDRIAMEGRQNLRPDVAVVESAPAKAASSPGKATKAS